MMVYLDSSAVLCRLLNQPDQLKGWGTWEAVYASTLMKAEVLRTIDRLRLDGTITDQNRADLNIGFTQIWNALYRVPLNENILESAAAPMPTVLGTLDAIHLVTALNIQSQLNENNFTLLTYDKPLARAAVSMGLRVGL